MSIIQKLTNILFKDKKGALSSFKLSVSFAIILGIFLFAMQVTSAATWDASDFGNGLDHYYNFNSQVNNDFGEILNASSWNVSSVTNPIKTGGKSGSFIDCSLGTNASYTVSKTLGAPKTANYSYAFWAYSNNSGSGLGHMVQDYFAGETRGWVGINYGGSNALYAESTPTVGVNTNYTIPANTWIHIVLTSGAGNHRLYANGHLVGVATGASSRGLTGNQVSSLCGTYGGTNYYKGGLDEVSYWNKILNVSDVTILYNSGAGFFYPTTSDAVYPVFFNYQDNNATKTGSGFVSFNVSINNTNSTVYLQINNANYSASSVSGYWNVSLNLTTGVYPYQWISWGNGSDKNFNVSGLRYYTVNATEVEYPRFFNYWDTNGTLLDNGLAHFNVSLNSTNTTVFLQINNVNHTASNASGYWNVSKLNLSGGVYPYQWITWGNGSATNFNVSGLRYYTVNATPPVESPWDSNHTGLNLTHYYSFDVQTSNNFKDEINGTWNISSASNPVNTLGKNNNYINCLGANASYAGNGASLGLPQTDYYSWSLWVKPNITGGTFNRFITNYFVSNTSGWAGLTFVDGKAYAEVTPVVGLSTNFTFSAGTWAHVVITSKSGAHNYYVNGNLVGTSASASAPSKGSNATVSICGIAKDTQNFHNGGIDEVAVFDRIINSSDIAFLYNAGDGNFYGSTGDNIYPVFYKQQTNNGTLIVNGIARFNVSINNTNGTVYLTINNSNFFASNTSGYWNVSVNLSTGVYPYTWNTFGNGSANNSGATNTAYYTVNATAPPTGTIAITYPTAKVLFARHNTTTGQMKITGTYTGTPVTINASFNGGQSQTIVASPSGGAFTGYLNASVGNGTLVVTFGNDVATTTSLSDTSVGDLIVVAGQSNGCGYGINNTAFNTSLGYSAYVYNGGWKTMDDPNGCFNAGTPYPQLANLIVQNAHIPVAFIMTAVSGSQIILWQPEGANYINMNNSINSATSGSFKVNYMLYYQGEDDVALASPGCNGNYNCYYTNLTRLKNAFFNQTGNFANKMFVAQIGIDGYVQIGYKLDTIRMAQQDAWDFGQGFYQGSIGYDHYIYDAQHWRSDAEITELARRWYLAVGTNQYSLFNASSPKVVNSNFSKNVTGATIYLEFDRNINISYYNKTLSNLARGFNISWNGVDYKDSDIPTTEIQNGKIVKLSLTGVQSTSIINFSFARDNSAYMQPVFADAIYSLPTRPIYSLLISNTTLIADTTNPLISFGIGTLANNTNSSQSSIYVNVSWTEDNPSSIAFWFDNVSRNYSIPPVLLFDNLTGQTDGIHYYFVEICDASNNCNRTETRRVNLDANNPTISISYPTAGTYYTNLSSINYTITDINNQTCFFTNNSGVNNYSISCASTSYLINASNGVYSWSILANDSYGHFSKSTVNFTITDPVVSPPTGGEGGGGGTTTITSSTPITLSDIEITYDDTWLVNSRYTIRVKAINTTGGPANVTDMQILSADTILRTEYPIRKINDFTYSRDFTILDTNKTNFSVSITAQQYEKKVERTITIKLTQGSFVEKTVDKITNQVRNVITSAERSAIWIAIAVGVLIIVIMVSQRRK